MPTSGVSFIKYSLAILVNNDRVEGYHSNDTPETVSESTLISLISNTFRRTWFFCSFCPRSVICILYFTRHFCSIPSINLFLVWSFFPDGGRPDFGVKITKINRVLSGVFLPRINNFGKLNLLHSSFMINIDNVFCSSLPATVIWCGDHIYLWSIGSYSYVKHT